MNKDRIAGAAKQAKGAVEQAAGRVLGDAKLVADGWNDKIKGMVQSAVGSIKNVMRKWRAR